MRGASVNGLDRGTGASARIAPRAFISSQAPAGTSVAAQPRMPSSSATSRGPGRTQATASWARGNWRAIAARGTPASSATARSASTRATTSAGASAVVPRRAADQDARVERPAADDARARRQAGGQQVVQGILLQQGVAAGEAGSRPIGRRPSGTGRPRPRSRPGRCRQTRPSPRSSSSARRPPSSRSRRWGRVVRTMRHRADVVDVEQVDAVAAQPFAGCPRRSASRRRSRSRRPA